MIENSGEVFKHGHKRQLFWNTILTIILFCIINYFIRYLSAKYIIQILKELVGGIKWVLWKRK